MTDFKKHLVQDLISNIEHVMSLPDNILAHVTDWRTSIRQVIAEFRMETGAPQIEPRGPEPPDPTDPHVIDPVKLRQRVVDDGDEAMLNLFDYWNGRSAIYGPSVDDVFRIIDKAVK